MSQISNYFTNSGPGGYVQTITPNTGADLYPTAGEIDILGGNNITTVGTSPSTLTINVTGTTNHDVQVGNASGSLTSITNGTTGQVLTATTGANPSWENLPASGITTIDGDSGSVTGSTVTISGGTTGLTTSGSGTTMDLTGTLIVGNGGTGVATMTTAYAPVCAGTTATGNLQVASTGLSTSGYVLTSNGSSALPSFKAAPGSLVQVGTTQTASNSATISFTSAISASYNTYLLNFSNVAPASNNEPFQMLISTNNGSSYISTSYQSGVNQNAYNSASTSNVNSTSLVVINNGASSTAVFSGSLWISNTGNGGSFQCFGETVYIVGGGMNYNSIFAYNPATGVNALQLSMAAGNIATGTFSLYGLVGS